MVNRFVYSSIQKFQASLLAPDQHSEVYELEPLMKPLLEPLCPPASNAEGSSDANPIVIPGVEAEQFRDLLLVLLGRYVPTCIHDLLKNHFDTLLDQTIQTM